MDERGTTASTTLTGGAKQPERLKRKRKRGGENMQDIKGTLGNTVIFIIDEPGHGGACHEYRIAPEGEPTEFAKISFQNGPVKEYGMNGCTQEDLLKIVIHRLECFQSGSFACEENAWALKECKEALRWLNQRTETRIQRGVEGTNVR